MSLNFNIRNLNKNDDQFKLIRFKFLNKLTIETMIKLMNEISGQNLKNKTLFER